MEPWKAKRGTATGWQKQKSHGGSKEAEVERKMRQGRDEQRPGEHEARPVPGHSEACGRVTVCPRAAPSTLGSTVPAPG